MSEPKKYECVSGDGTTMKVSDCAGPYINFHLIDDQFKGLSVSLPIDRALDLIGDVAARIKIARAREDKQ